MKRWKAGLVTTFRCLLYGMMLGGVAGAAYGFVVIFWNSLQNGGDLGYASVAAFVGGMLGTGGGAVTGAIAGLLTALAGPRFTALAWWLGGAAGGFAAASYVQPAAELWWHGPPTLIGAAAGAALGWFLQRTSA